MEKMFEEASRSRLRYGVSNGIISTEDLWDLKLEALDKLAKILNKELKDSSEESFIKTKTTENKTLELKFELVKYVIKVKLKEKEDKEQAELKKQKRAQLLELIEKKELNSLEGKTIDELKAEYEALS